MSRTSIALVLLVTCSSAHGVDLISMAHKAGFNRCDDAISKEFSSLSENGEGVASTGYFNNRSFSVMATWGNEKDSVWKNTTFIKFGRRCLVYSLVGSTFPSTCSVFKEKNPQWETKKKVVDFTWTQNKGGINALLKDLPGNNCSVTYRIHQAYNIDSPIPVTKTAQIEKNKNKNKNKNTQE
ncbi:MAG: hypothetical protein QS748_00295 [Candidatus Endonucleobacter bathymodioli]|uniref:Uncharacterized protein n=1 Tax=Candidatus Endonucleibacter bathymodioli TaxID=539814 RepID=A0AA90NNY7_9GAMM|nr:hypothetical protein [Candidatus Endonucleobacter bathymodioli]